MGRLLDFVANCQDGVFAVDRSQVIVLWNDSAAEILGYSPVEVLGEPCYGLIHGTDSNGCAVCRHRCDAIRAAEKLEAPPTRDVRVRTKQGEQVWIDVSTIVAPSKRGHLEALIHVFRERTKDHRLREIACELSGVVSKPGSAPDRTPAPSTDETVKLTKREREVVSLLAMGGSTEKIAGRLCISPRTVRNHVNNILRKLGVHSRLEAVTYSIRNGLL